MRYLLLIPFLLLSYSSQSQNVSYDSIYELADYNFILGTQGIGGSYKFTQESALIEQAKHIRAMGSNILKISLSKKAQKVYSLQKTQSKTVLEQFKNTSDFQEVFDMDFKYIFSWVHTLTEVKWKNRFNKEDQKKIYDEMYEFTSFLLKKYNNSGKTFFIGNWEGDWLLHSGFNRKITPEKQHIKNMTKWLNVRQKAIDDAKKDTHYKNVSLYHYVEVNLVLKGMDGKACIAESILPKTNVDMVSYSSYEAIKNKTYKEKTVILESIFKYLEKQLKPKKDIPFERRVFIGEYGYQANINKPESFEKQYIQTKEIMQISLELNLPFALHWEMYNNEYNKNGVSKEMSLISEDGTKRPLYYLHKNYYKALNNYITNYKQLNKTYPKPNEFNNKAIELLKSL